MKEMSLLIKPASGMCNMSCDYCFYKDEMRHRKLGNRGIMSRETSREVIRKTLESVDERCTFLFQGGEPTLAGMGFYEDFIRCVERYNTREIQINYGIQTNGYRLGREWASFLHENRFLVGVSLDGMEQVHDYCRKNTKGEGTFHAVMETIRLFREYKVEFNILTVVTKYNASYVNQIYNFFKREHLGFQQYIECLEPIEGSEKFSMSPKEYGEFLIALFRKWYRDLVGGNYVSIRYFENLLLMFSGKQPESCNMRGCCSKQWVVEADGSVYPCDFYALDEWKMGNFNTDSIEDIKKADIGEWFVETSKQIPKECKKCEWYPICRNGCRRNCLYLNGKRKINKYCEAYKIFLEYAYPKLRSIIRWI